MVRLFLIFAMLLLGLQSFAIINRDGYIDIQNNTGHRMSVSVAIGPLEEDVPPWHNTYFTNFRQHRQEIAAFECPANRLSNPGIQQYTINNAHGWVGMVPFRVNVTYTDQTSHLQNVIQVNIDVDHEGHMNIAEIEFEHIPGVADAAVTLENPNGGYFHETITLQ